MWYLSILRSRFTPTLENSIKRQKDEYEHEHAPDDKGDGVWRRDGLPARWKAAPKPSACDKVDETMNEQQFLHGWDLPRRRRTREAAVLRRADPG